MTLKDQFLKLTKSQVQFRPVSFWSWNDELDAGELVRQLNQMAKAGMGGHFMHAREGLVTEYMGASWMQCVKTAVAASKAAGIRAWLYDEDRWPSGSAGGAIPAMSMDFAVKQLRWEEIPPVRLKPAPETIATFLVRSRDDDELDIRPIDPKLAARKAKPPDQVLHFFYESNRNYTDLLSPAAVKEFIRHTYEGYRAAVGAEFGRTVPGVFTDEPQWSQVPWSAELPKCFKKLHGYDLLPQLPLLVHHTPGSTGLRYDFWRAATELFVESYVKQLGQWCHKKKLALTGHLMGEDSLSSQSRFIGAAMPHYPHMQIPGIDQLGRFITDPLPCKQASSVAHQFGGRRVLSEMFGCAGWNVSFEELKWLAEWQFVQGVDFCCTHLSHYSLRGCRKRDYPPSLHYQQPWWDDYPLLTGHLARLTFMLTRGKHLADVLVLHPAESAWAAYDPADSRKIEELNESLAAVCRALLGFHRDFDFGDESILAASGRVSGRRLRVKSAEYSVVIVPPCLTLRKTTVGLLDRFRKAGGAVILLGPPPELMDGRPSPRPAETLAHASPVHLEPARLKEELRKTVPPRIEVLDKNGAHAATVWVQQRDLRQKQVFFLANTSKDTRVDATVRLPGTGRLERWDPETGQARPLATRRRSRMLETALEFEPMGSHLLVLHKRKKPAVVRQKKTRLVLEIPLGDTWSLERTDPNALTLDYCSYRIGNGEWSAQMPVLTVQDNLRHVVGSEVCEFKYSFDALFSAKLPQTLHLVVEEPGAYEISMNGLAVGTRTAEGDLGWWRDISFRRLDIAHLLKPQDRNEIILRRLIAGEAERKRQMAMASITAEQKNRLHYGPEIESIYITGEFLLRASSPWETLDRRAVRTAAPFVLADTWSQVTTGDLVQQGLPFYAGRVRLTQTVMISEKQLKTSNGVRLHLEPPDAITTKILVNGKPAGVRAWRPYDFETGSLLVPGRNEIRIELAASCRNLLGPHHHVDGELHFVGPASFRTAKSWTDSPTTPAQVWTDRYSFVRFGLAGPATLTLWK